METAFQKKHMKHVLATVVDLDGSSYRKPGVQMLVSQDGTMTGAVSGGCVEDDVVFHSQTVFETHQPKIMTYNGRYRLGCEGVLYILLESFEISSETYHHLQIEFNNRRPISFTSFYQKEEAVNASFGSQLTLGNKTHISFRADFHPNKDTLKTFHKTFPALMQFIIIGAEHDAVSLCAAAAQLGWEVLVVSSPSETKNIHHFPGAKHLYCVDADMPFDFTVDAHTAVVLMNHNYARDLHFLVRLMESNPFYIGILGSIKRREKLMNEVVELHPEIDFDFVDAIYSPAGINIGAITPQEISISILSEIIAVRSKKQVPSLREIKIKTQE